MIFKTISTIKAHNLLVIPLLTGILWIKYFAFSAIETTNISEFQMPLFQLINNFFVWSDTILLLLINILILVQVYLLIRLNNKFIVIDKRTYLHGIIFTVFCISLNNLNNLLPALFANIFIILATEKIFDTYKSDSLFSNYFDATLLISISSLLHFNAIFLIVFVFAGQIIIRSFNFREWLIIILGLLTPYIILFLYFFLVDNLLFFNELAEYYFFDYQNKFELSLIKTGYYVFILILLLISGIFSLNKFNKLKINRRKFYTLFFLLIIFSAAILYSLPKAGFETLVFVSVPFSFIISDYLLAVKKKWYSEFIFLLLLAGSILAQLF